MQILFKNYSLSHLSITTDLSMFHLKRIHGIFLTYDMLYFTFRAIL